jgi:hypothetical protein
MWPSIEYTPSMTSNLAASGFTAENVAQVIGAVVRKPFHRRHREPDAIPEARVDIFVGEDDVALLRERGDARKTGQIAGDVDVAGFAAEKCRESLLELDVDTSASRSRCGHPWCWCPT